MSKDRFRKFEDRLIEIILSNLKKRGKKLMNKIVNGLETGDILLPKKL